MSPNVGNFVHDLVEMAKAMELLPQVQSDLEQANKMNAEQGAVIAAREESILKLKAEIEGLNSKVRSAEEARDQAETMFLELDDKAAKVVKLLAQIQGMAVQAECIIDPPKPQPEPVPEPKIETGPVTENEFMRSSTEHQAEPHPVEPDSSGWNHNIEPAPTSPGQSEPDPTIHTESNTAPAGSTESPVSHTDPIASTQPDPTANPSHDNDPEPTRYVGQSQVSSDDWWDWANRQEKAGRAVKY